MIAQPPPLDDLTLTITVERPKGSTDEGRIQMTAESVGLGGILTEKILEGPDNDVTRTRALQHSYAFLQNGQKSHVARLRRDNGQDRGR